MQEQEVKGISSRTLDNLGKIKILPPAQNVFFTVEFGVVSQYLPNLQPFWV